MYTLYNILQIKKSTTKREMIKSHQRLYKKYAKINDQNKLVEINKALMILSKPLNQNFYNVFGDRFLFIINNSNITYMLLNVATLKNFFFISIYLISTLIFIVFYFSINLLLKNQSYLIKNSVYIFGSFFLLLCLVNCMFRILKLRNYFKIFYFYLLIPLLYTAKLIIICCYLDHQISTALAIANMLVCNLLFFLLLFLKEKNNLEWMTYVMRICSELSLGLFFIKEFKQYMLYIPMIYLFFFNFYHHKIFCILFLSVSLRTLIFRFLNFKNHLSGLICAFAVDLLVFIGIIVLILKLGKKLNVLKSNHTSSLEKLTI